MVWHSIESAQSTEKLYTQYRGYGEIGKHKRLKISRRKSSQFKSEYPHQSSSIMTITTIAAACRAVVLGNDLMLAKALNYKATGWEGDSYAMAQRYKK